MKIKFILFGLLIFATSKNAFSAPQCSEIFLSISKGATNSIANGKEITLEDLKWISTINDLVLQEDTRNEGWSLQFIPRIQEILNELKSLKELKDEDPTFELSSDFQDYRNDVRSKIDRLKIEIDEVLTHISSKKINPYGAIFKISLFVDSASGPFFIHYLKTKYQEIALKHNWEVKFERESNTSIIIKIPNPSSYLFFASESGIHKLKIKKSEIVSKGEGGRGDETLHFNVKVDVQPYDTKDKNIEVSDRDIDYDTIAKHRGKGGQNVNKIESGIIASHKPTGISVESDEQRTQNGYRKIATEKLKEKVSQYYQFRAEEQRKELVSSLSLNENNETVLVRMYDFIENRVRNQRENQSTKVNVDGKDDLDFESVLYDQRLILEKLVERKKADLIRSMHRDKNEESSLEPLYNILMDTET